jgi:TolB-like protein/class 3 adenylate cyclase
MVTDDVKRKLTAIFTADVVGYSRLMGEDELATVQTLTSYKETMTKLIKHYRGRVLDSVGDNLMAEFASVVDAVQCAVEVQQVLSSKNEDLPENRKMLFRIGINLGDVIEEGDRIYGDGVNIAARVESLAEGGGVCISGSAFEQIENKLALGYQYMGEHTVKNIAKPVKVYRVPMGPVEGKEKRRAFWGWQKAVIGAVAVLILVGVAAALWHYYWRPTHPPIEVASVEKMAFPLPDKPSIAVLPFVNMSGDPEQEYLSDGLTEQIITGLSKVPKLFVIARNSTFTYKGKPVKVQKVAEDLGVRYILEGGVQISDERVRITTQLIDAVSGRHLWAENYDRVLKDIFAIQDEITMKIVTALDVKLTEGEQARLWARGTDNLQAYFKFLKAREQVRLRTREDNVISRKLAEEAISLDPNYAWQTCGLNQAKIRSNR